LLTIYIPNAVEECTTNLYADDMNIYSAYADPVVLSGWVERDLGKVADELTLMS